MHRSAWQWVAANVPDEPGSVVEVGSRDVNGSVRHLFWNATSYIGVDLVDGPGVDVACDFITYKPKGKVRTVVSCEVLEHCEHWRDLVGHAAEIMAKGGTLILTAACPPRAPHGVDGGEVGGEWYQNVAPGDLEDVLTAHFSEHRIEVDADNGDVRAVAKL